MDEGIAQLPSSEGVPEYDRMTVERALEYEFRHGTELGREMYRYLDRQLVSPAGVLMQCVQEGAGPVLYRMACLYADHLSTAGSGDKAPLVDGAVSRQIERDEVALLRMGGEL